MIIPVIGVEKVHTGHLAVNRMHIVLYYKEALQSMGKMGKFAVV